MQTKADIFRAIVDQSIADYPDPQVFARSIAAGRADAGDANALVAFLYEWISAALEESSPDRSNYDLLRRLRTQLYRLEAFDLPAEPYEQIINRIWDASRSAECRSLEDTAAWLEAITAARAVDAVRGEGLDSPGNRRMAVNMSIRFLRSQGFGLVLRDDDVGVVFRSGELGRLARSIDRDVRKLGGVKVLSHLFRVLRLNGQFDGDRYTPGRRLSMLGSARPPSTPFGYLLNIALKHIDAKGSGGAAEPKIWERLSKNASAMCSVIDVEPYSQFENIVISPHLISNYLSEISLFDHLLTFRQWTARHAAEIISEIFSDIDREWMKKAIGWTIEDALGLAERLLQWPPEPFDLRGVHEREIAGTCVSREAWRKMRADFVHDPRKINSSYRLPFDGNKQNWQDKPLAAISTSEYLLLPPSLSAPALFEAIVSALRRSRYPHLDDKVIPVALERLIFKQFATRGFTAYANKKYRIHDPAAGKKVDGECDVVVEGDGYILFIEAKKKPFTKASSTGYDLPNLIDLSDSLLHAQLQMAVHERLLRHHGYLEFRDGTRLTWNNRRIDRIAVTLLDHGSTQDKTVVSKIGRALAGVTIKAVHEGSGYAQALAKLNERSTLLAYEIIELEKMGVSQVEQGVGRWFLSVPQLLVLLEMIGDPAEFGSRFGKLRHTTLSVLDFYRELKLSERSGLFSSPDLGIKGMMIR